MILGSIKIKKTSTLCFVIMLLIGCRNEQSDNFFQGDYETKNYQADPRIVEHDGVRVAIKTKGDLQHGELVLMMNIKNNSKASIAVDYASCELNLEQDSRVAVPRLLRPFKSTLPVDEDETYEIYFYPINSISFYDNAEYRGDMKPYYSLDLDFITDTSGRKLFNEHVVLALPDSTYQNYVAHQAREKGMQIFSFDLNSDVFDNEQAGHLTRILKPGAAKEQPAVYSINPSITINRMIFNIFGYKEKDTLVVNMRMLNEDEYRLKVIADNCIVKVGENSYKPVSYFSDSFEDNQLPDSIYIFKPGTRLHLKLKYYMPQNLESWTFQNHWLLIDADKNAGRWEKLLFSGIAFRKPQ